MDKTRLEELSVRQTIGAQERGRRSYREGYNFEDKVAEIYRLLKYSVQHGRLFSGRQVDLFLSMQLGDLPVRRAIECKLGEVGSREIDEFHIKLQLVRKDYPDASGTIVSGVSFSDAARTHAMAAGINLVLYQELASTIIDGHRYVASLRQELHGNDNYKFSTFVAPRIGHEIEGSDRTGFELVDEWLADGESRQLTLLGDLGTGKSFLMRIIADRLITKFLAGPHENPFPVLVDLREADREISREGIIITHFARHGLDGVSFALFQRCLSEGNLVLILDGFDEMASKVSQNITVRNFNELMRCVQGRAKVLLTCRTHYFRDRTEEEEVILATSNIGETAPAKDLYWDLIGRRGFQIAYLRPFGLHEIDSYVRAVRPSDALNVLTLIRSTYDLMGLSSRPLLLDMIVKTIDRLTSRKVNIATIYATFTDIWIQRDSWRNVLSDKDKRRLLTAIAVQFWKTGQFAFHYTELRRWVNNEFLNRLQDERQLIEIDHEVRTASFLTRDSQGFYAFAHKSYAEFFISQDISSKLKRGEIDCLDGQRLTPEIATFLGEMLDDANVDGLLESTLRSSYRAVVSENALFLLYNIRRRKLRINHPIDAQPVELPLEIQLPAAQLSQVNLEHCVMRQANLQGADLSQSNLACVDFSGSDLSGARLDKADIQRARFCQCTMVETSLVAVSAAHVDVSAANLTRAALSFVDLSTAVVRDTIWTDANFNNAVVPPELGRLVGGQTDIDRIKSHTKKRLSIEGSPWHAVEGLFPLVLSLVRRNELYMDVDVEDLAMEAILRLLQSREAGDLTKLSQADLLLRVKSAIIDINRREWRRRASTVSLSESAVDRDPGDRDGLNDDTKYGELLWTDDEDKTNEIYVQEVLSRARNRLPTDYWPLLDDMISGDSFAELAAKRNVSVQVVRRMVERIRDVIRDILTN